MRKINHNILHKIKLNDIKKLVRNFNFENKINLSQKKKDLINDLIKLTELYIDDHNNLYLKNKKIINNVKYKYLRDITDFLIDKPEPKKKIKLKLTDELINLLK